MNRIFTTLIAIVVVLSTAMAVRAGDAARAAERFAAGNDLLKQGQFDAALKAWADAARADGENQEYRKQFALLRRVIVLRKGLAGERNPDKRRADAQAVRSFLYGQALYEQAVILDQDCHERLPGADTATLLAESLLEVGRDEDCRKLLSGMDAEALSDQGRLLFGIALARTGQVDEARKLAGRPASSVDADPALLLHAARLRAAIGNAPDACATLAKALRATRPSQIEAARTRVTACADFASIHDTAEFKAALATASQVPESTCSTGRDCGSCAGKTKCSVATTTQPAGTGS